MKRPRIPVPTLLRSDRRGSTALEIALIAAAIAVAVVFALRFLQDA